MSADCKCPIDKLLSSWKVRLTLIARPLAILIVLALAVTSNDDGGCVPK
jgi:hypothetical protein